MFYKEKIFVTKICFEYVTMLKYVLVQGTIASIALFVVLQEGTFALKYVLQGETFIAKYVLKGGNIITASLV